MTNLNLINRRDLGSSFELGVDRANQNLVVSGPPAPALAFPVQLYTIIGEGPSLNECLNTVSSPENGMIVLRYLIRSFKNLRWRMWRDLV